MRILNTQHVKAWVRGYSYFTIYMYMYAYYCISDPKILGGGGTQSRDGKSLLLYATLVTASGGENICIMCAKAYKLYNSTCRKGCSRCVANFSLIVDMLRLRNKQTVLLPDTLSLQLSFSNATSLAVTPSLTPTTHM